MDRDFKGVWIPKEIWLDERLSALDKIIFVEIDSLCSEEKGCYASNSYLAEFCQCSETKISKAISKLLKLGYIYLINFNGRRRELQSCLVKSARQTCKKCKADKQKVQGYINNIDNNIDNNISKKEREKKSPEKDIEKTSRESFDKIIEIYAKGEKELEDKLKAFVQMRFRINKPITNQMLYLLLSKLEKHSKGDIDLKLSILENSLIGGYPNLYPVKKINTNNYFENETSASYDMDDYDNYSVLEKYIL